MKAFLERKKINLSWHNYFVTAMGAMAQGLFASLLIGTILGTVGNWTGWAFLNDIAAFAKNNYVVGAAIGVAVAAALKAEGLVLFSCAVVGAIGYMSYNADNSTVEIGYSLAREQWGKGLMTEALTAVIDETFHTLDIHRIEALHFTDNPASGRVMAKCGMTHEGHMRERVCCKGVFRDVEMWGILRGDWEKHHKK